MKQLFSIFAISALLVACGGQTSQTSEEAVTEEVVVDTTAVEEVEVEATEVEVIEEAPASVE
jgi:uncharacterized protein YcfL